MRFVYSLFVIMGIKGDGIFNFGSRVVYVYYFYLCVNYFSVFGEEFVNIFINVFYFKVFLFFYSFYFKI